MRGCIINKESKREERTQEQWRSGQGKRYDKRMSGNERAAARCYEPHGRSALQDNDDCTDKTHTHGRRRRRRMIEEERNVLTQIKPPLVSGLWSLDPAGSKAGRWSRRVTICPQTYMTQRPRSSSGLAADMYTIDAPVPRDGRLRCTQHCCLGQYIISDTGDQRTRDV